MKTYEISYRLGKRELDNKLLDFIEKQRIIKKAGAGDIDEIRLVTGMRVVHYNGLSYKEGKEMNLPQEEDILNIVVLISKIEAFYSPIEKPDFTIVQMGSQKYMIHVAFNTMLELSRLLKSTNRQFDLATDTDIKLSKGGGIS